MLSVRLQYIVMHLEKSDYADPLSKLREYSM